MSKPTLLFLLVLTIASGAILARALASAWFLVRDARERSPAQLLKDRALFAGGVAILLVEIGATFLLIMLTTTSP
ncbi:MAG TPA: hypothetical protein VH393_10345 [Ktedonobacterales bacterium]|jgi:hypothetical protein